MRSALGRGRALVGLGAVLAGLLLAWCPSAFALNPSLDVSQYAHTAWKIRDGFAKGTIDAIAQTPDGYLWLGTEFGLLRFDGVRAVAWQPPAGETLPSSWIRSLCVGRDGTLWIGTLKGLVSWNNRKLTQYPRLAGMSVVALVEDRQGTVWAAGSELPGGKLCAVEGVTGSVRCDGEDGVLGTFVSSVFEDGYGNLWAGAQNGLWRWRPGPPIRFAELADANIAYALIQGQHQAVVVATMAGLRQLVDGRLEEYPVAGGLGSKSSDVLRDREGSLWIGIYGAGLTHVHQGRTDVFVHADGLSSDYVQRLFEDREGNLWVATNDGLDRFREFAVSTISVKQGLPSENVTSVLPAADGGVWFGTSRGLDKWKDGRIDHDLAATVRFLVEDNRGRFWVATEQQVGYLESGRLVSVTDVPGGMIRSMIVDGAGGLWVAHQDRGLFHVRAERGVESIPWSTLGRRDFASAIVADHTGGGLWLGFYQGGVVHFADGRIRASYTAADGLGRGVVNDLRIEQDGTVWAATDGGLSQVKDERRRHVDEQERFALRRRAVDEGRRRPCRLAEHDLRPRAHRARRVGRLGSGAGREPGT